ncbi:MAG: DUF3006 domain-containing protein [Acutalibacteraceae bacterium]|nr:DUF3006 domain-containing protein [Acutalibacteraceae bacterium]
MIILDRFEGDFAVIYEEDVLKNIPKDLVEKKAKEGSVLIKKENKYFLDEKNTAVRHKKIAELQDSLFED